MCTLAAILLGTLTPSMGAPELPFPQAPQPKPGWYKALGGGAHVICGSFVAEMEKGPWANQLFGNTVISWVHGFLSASLIADAAHEMIVYLYQRRANPPPQESR